MPHSPAWDDLSVFVDPDDFAVPGEISFSDGTTKTVNGIFDWPGIQPELGQYTQDDISPRFTAIASELKGARRGDTITIQGRVFDILEYPQPDGTGMAVLELAVPANA